MYVWIPRYTYKITSGYHEDVDSWNADEGDNKTGKIEIKFSQGTTDDTSDSYLSHPAFTFGSDSLTGIWVAKYEASQGTTESEVSTPTASNSVARSVPNVASWTGITVSKMFDYSYNTYRNADSHLVKNVEWGAVAYLTNAIGRIPYINNSSSYITGNAGGSQDASSASGVTNAWNTANGVKASTTHNIYGIYDLSGGAEEYVAAYVNNGNSSLTSYASSLVNSYSNYGTKYVDVYTTNMTQYAIYQRCNDINGEAVYEISSSSSGNTSWDGDTSYMPFNTIPVFCRSGDYNDGNAAGIFGFCGHAGGGLSGAHGFRLVLCVK